MLSGWLNREPREPSGFTRFEVVDVTEVRVPNDANVEAIATAIRDSRVDPDLVREVAQRLGWHRAELMLTGATPRNETTRRGVFGEILAMASLTEFEGWIIPVAKLRHTPAPDPSPPGTDILALRLEGSTVTALLMEEVKLRTTSVSGVALSAYDELDKAMERSFPDVLTFALGQLRKEDAALYDGLLGYLERRKEDTADTYRVTLVCDDAIWREQALVALEELPPSLTPLSISVLRVAGLRALADRTFGLIGVTDLREDEGDVANPQGEPPLND